MATTSTLPRSLHVQRLLDGGRSVLLQPYLDRVDEHGETALIYFDGALQPRDPQGPAVAPRRRTDARAVRGRAHHSRARRRRKNCTLAEQTLAAIPFAKPLLYARVDLIHDAAGAPCVLELELTEPSLFFAHAPGSAQRFASAVIERVRTLTRSAAR